uniref:Uncharacterized protein n=1 Tax=viral metagenome TaxID=1070528 RepID=A0A6H2A2J2_9ZZZZ
MKDGLYKGASMGLTNNPERQGYDPAEQDTSTDRKIVDLLTNHLADLSEWEQHFLASCYSASPLTRKQHIVVSRLAKKFSSKGGA